LYEETAEEWRREYLRGASMEIYRTPLSPYFLGRTHRDATCIIYKNFGAILIGIEKLTSKRQGMNTNTTPTRAHNLYCENNGLLSSASDQVGSH